MGPSSANDSVCNQAADTLATCGNSFDQSPFGTCQPDQRKLAQQVMSTYAQKGCAGLVSGKADSLTCDVLPFLCVEHSVAELAPFSTDGCSMFPDGTPSDRTKWQSCCIVHDEAYYKGGPAKLKKQADSQLRSCIAEKSGSTWLAGAVYYGVRIGGTPALPTPWRWGYGWKYDPMNGYRDIPQNQWAAAQSQVQKYQANPWPPDAFEQRMYALWDKIGIVPGLKSLVKEVQDKVAEM